MRRFEVEARATMPPDFDPWFQELMLLGDCEGVAAVIGIVMHYAPIECFRALALNQSAWSELIARAQFADHQRYRAGVMAGRAWA